MKYIVRGEAEVYVDFKCEAESVEEAMKIATSKSVPITNFCGVVLAGKLAEVYGKNTRVYIFHEIEWVDVEEMEE